MFFFLLLSLASRFNLSMFNISEGIQKHNSLLINKIRVFNHYMHAFDIQESKNLIISE